jgi:uncharacterized protein YndB with AHSA1/START domain
MKSNITGHAATSIHASASQVWDALTKPEIIKQYFFGTNAKSDWKPGSPVTFTGEWKGKTYEDKGTVLKAEPGKLLQYTYWSSMSGIEDKPENYVIITFELKEENDNTILTLTQQNIPDEKTKEHSEENWRTVLNNLKTLLESKKAAYAPQQD